MTGQYANAREPRDRPISSTRARPASYHDGCSLGSAFGCRIHKRGRSHRTLVFIAWLVISAQPCASWWVGSGPAPDCADGDLGCISAQMRENHSESQKEEPVESQFVDAAEVATLKAELELLRAEVHSLRSELMRKHQITESLAGALQELRKEKRESESKCESQLQTMMSKLQGKEQTPTSQQALQADSEHVRPRTRQHLAVNGFEEDQDGQTEWIYGVPNGRRKIVIELGANNGEWISQFLQMHSDFWPIIVEAQPGFKDVLREIARNHGGVYLQRAAWVTEGDEMTFHAHTDAGGMGSSLFGDSVYSEGFCDGELQCKKSAAESYKVMTLDVVELIRRFALPDDFIVLRMDIEGAEYQVARRLVLSGVACWVNNWEFEGHAMYAKQNHKFRPVDGVLPWLVRGCGVQMNVYQYYKVDPKLKKMREEIEARDQCGWLRYGVDGCSEAGSCGGIQDAD